MAEAVETVAVCALIGWGLWLLHIEGVLSKILMGD
jgi:hypothetical protein